jgi:hypothetical protein
VKRILHFAPVIGVFSLVLCSGASAFEQPRIVNGLNTTNYPTTGQLLYGGPFPITDNSQASWCTGTLIGCSTFLTAAHCVEEDTTASHYRVFLQNAGVLDVASIATHPNYTSGGFPEFDVAVLKLTAPVTAIDPTAINTSASPPFGTVGTIVGFGQTDGSGQGAQDYGIKRAGLVQTTNCAGLLSGLGNSELVCWNFLSPLGTPGLDSNTCNGDSGGPLFVDIGGGEVVAGITSGGTSFSCLPTDNSYDANVFTYQAFITAELGADSTAPCGGLPAVGSPSVLVGGESAILGSSVPTKVYIVHVTGTPSEIRFALNGENPGFDVDFYVKEGLGVSTGDFDCKSDSASTFEECVFATPTPGPWSVLVRRFSGQGEFQLTTTVVDGDPPVCGNDLAEFGETCDGTDDSECPGACGVTCACPCEEKDILNVKLKSNAKIFRFKGDLDNTSGVFTGVDPRNEFAFALIQDSDVVSVEIPSLDAGWSKSKPEKLKYVWKGSIGGITRIKILDKTANKGVFKLQFKGKNVPGAVAIDALAPYQAQTYFDTVCNRIDF